jgi:hypothetical protein
LRTIADLAGSANITATHFAEAIQFRYFERAMSAFENVEKPVPSDPIARTRLS